MVVTALGSIGCIGSAEDKPLQVATGDQAGVTPDGLVRMTGSALEGVWVKPDADIAAYDEVMVAPARVAYKRKPKSTRYSATRNNFALSKQQVDALEQLFKETFVKQVDRSKEWKLTDAPGPDVLLLEPFLLDLVVSTPMGNALPNESVYTTSTGSVTLVLEVRDSLSDEILGRMADRSEARAPGTGANNLYWSNTVTNTEAVRLVFERWSRIMMARLNTARRLHPSEPLHDEAPAAEPAGSGGEAKG